MGHLVEDAVAESLQNQEGSEEKKTGTGKCILL